MAGNGGHGSGGVADWLAQTATANGGLLVLPAQQPALGHLGLVCRGLGADHAAGVSGVDEHPRREKERPHGRSQRLILTKLPVLHRCLYSDRKRTD